MSQRTKAAKKFMREGHNCAQSVIYAFKNDIGLTEEAILNIAERCASGTCIKCGAILALRIVMYRMVRQESAETVNEMENYIVKMEEEFRNKMGAITCRELRENKFIDSDFICIKCIEEAVKLLEENGDFKEKANN